MPWYIGTAIGGLTLALMNSIKKTMPITLLNFAILFPLLVIVQIGFWYGFKNGHNFIVTWFTGSAMSAISAVIISLLYFKEPFRWEIMAGMACIVCGQFLLANR